MKLTRIHQFIREYDASSKSEAEVDLFIQNILYVSKHYGLSMEVENMSDLNLSEIFPEEEFSEGGLRVFPSFFAPLNEVLGYGGYLTGQLVTVAGAPARGKTTFLFNEAVNFALSGKRVLYFALADQDKADLILKFLSIFYGYRFLKRIEEEKGREALLEFIENTYNGLVFPDAYADVGGYHNPLFDLSPSRIHARNPRLFLEDPEVKRVISRIDIVVETEVRPHIQDIQATVMSRSNEPDVIIVDYDRSIKAKTTEGLYQEGEEIYDGLVALTKPKGGKKKLVIVASQINKGYWHLPDPPLQSLAESSRKQAISDIVITIGKNLEKTGVHEGFISLVKNRRGPTGKFGYFLLPTTNMVPWSPEYINEEKKKARRKKREVLPESEESE
jgi:replicative DNA helicase